MTTGPNQLYVALGDETPGGSTVVRIWWKPWVIFIWIGAIIMSFGGVVSLFDRRLRIGAPARRKVPAAVAEPTS